MTSPPPSSDHEVTVALLPWGNVIDEFLDSIGVSMEKFIGEFTGSWMFRYVAALREAGVRTVLVFVSARVAQPTRVTHVPTGATMHFLPAGRLHRLLRSRMRRRISKPSRPGSMTSRTTRANSPLRAR